MDTIRLGRTNLIVSKNGFGALPVQRVGMNDACHLLRKAYENGINYFDTARAYSDSEEKLGIAKERLELIGEFCRGCGYCMPCPAGIEINNCARMSLLLRRAPSAGFLTEQWQNNMKKIENCLECGQCATKCPYGLDTPALLKKNYEDYKTFLK